MATVLTFVLMSWMAATPAGDAHLAPDATPSESAATAPAEATTTDVASEESTPEPAAPGPSAETAPAVETEPEPPTPDATSSESTTVAVAPPTPAAPPSGGTVSDKPHKHRPEKVWRGLVRVGGLTDSGPLPDVGLAGLMTVGVNGPWVSFQVFGRAWLPRRARLPEIEDPNIRAWAWAAGPRGCFRHEVGEKIELPACLGVSLGQIYARPFGVDPAPRSTHFWAEGNVTIGVTLKLREWVGLAGAFESGFRFKADPLYIDDVAYHTPSHTALRAFLSLEFRFPRR